MFIGDYLTIQDNRINITISDDIVTDIYCQREVFLKAYITTLKDKFDKTLNRYSLMTTKPKEVEARKQKEMEE